MSFDQLRTACVVRFPNLWVREAERDETEGRKARGRFSKAFFLPLMKEFIARRAHMRGVNRRR